MLVSETARRKDFCREYGLNNTAQRVPENANQYSTSFLLKPSAVGSLVRSGVYRTYGDDLLMSQNLLCTRKCFCVMEVNVHNDSGALKATFD